MKKFLVIVSLMFAALIIGCSGDNDAVKAAKKAGWTDVTVTNSAWLLDFTCSKGEKRYNIKGKNPRGKWSKAVVCCNHTKIGKRSCTIRYD